MSTKRPSISAFFPAYNDGGTIGSLVVAALTTLAELTDDYEVIVVENGSTDYTVEVLQALEQQYDHFKALTHREALGYGGALRVGFAACSKDLIFYTDGDAQYDPRELKQLLLAMTDDVDVVNGWKLRRLDPWHKVYPSKVFNWLVARLTGLRLHDHNCGLKLFRAEVAREVRLYGELHRFVPVLAHARGFRVTELAVNHRPRRHGVSKYGIRRFLRGFLDLLTVTSYDVGSVTTTSRFGFVRPPDTESETLSSSD